MKTIRKLTSRQWALYNLVKEYSEKGIALEQDFIVDSIKGYEHSKNPKNHNDCTSVWSDVWGDNGINWSSEVDKIIVIDNFTYKLGNEKDLEMYAKDLQKKALRGLKRFWAIIKKMKNDGQLKLLSNQMNPIDENSKARTYVETFVNEVKEMEADLNAKMPKEKRLYTDEELMSWSEEELKEYFLEIGGTFYTKVYGKKGIIDEIRDYEKFYKPYEVKDNE